VAGHRAALATALSITLATAVCLWLACAYQDDFHVYLAGAHDLFSGTLYSQSTRGDLFTYPSFAALLFVPLEWLPSTTAAQVVWALLNETALLALLIVVIRAVRPDIPRRSRRLWALGLSAPALFLDPVLLAVRHGQVDILVTLFVVWDLVGARRLGTRTVPHGVATGLAAAIKLTPLIWLGTSLDRPSWGRGAAAFTAVLFWVSPIWWVADEGTGPLHESGWQLIAGSSFFLWMVLLLAACAASYFLREYSTGILLVMSVPLTLLGLLERGPSHGYDLKRDYDAYFGRGRPLRYSQVYATLSRLARDGKTVPGPVEQGAGPERRRYVITEAGIAEVEQWLAEPAPPEPDLTSELFAKVVLALMLGRRADSYLDVQRAAHLQRMRELTELKRDSDQIGVLLADHAIYRLEADLRWIDHTAARLDLLARAVQP